MHRLSAALLFVLLTSFVACTGGSTTGDGDAGDGDGDGGVEPACAPLGATSPDSPDTFDAPALDNAARISLGDGTGTYDLFLTELDDAPDAADGYALRAVWASNDDAGLELTLELSDLDEATCDWSYDGDPGPVGHFNRVAVRQGGELFQMTEGCVLGISDAAASSDVDFDEVAGWLSSCVLANNEGTAEITVEVYFRANVVNPCRPVAPLAQSALGQPTLGQALYSINAGATQVLPVYEAQHLGPDLDRLHGRWSSPTGESLVLFVDTDRPTTCRHFVGNSIGGAEAGFPGYLNAFSFNDGTNSYGYDNGGDCEITVTEQPEWPGDDELRGFSSLCTLFTQDSSASVTIQVAFAGDYPPLGD